MTKKELIQSKTQEGKEKTTLNLDLIEKILAMIDSVGIKSEINGKERIKQEAELLERKKQARDFVEDALCAVKNYVEIVSRIAYLVDRQKFYLEEDEFRRLHAEMDSRRRIAHENLISSLNIANRYILQNFGAISDEYLEEWQGAESKRKKIILDVARVHFPINLLCPDSINFNNRYAVAKWAADIADELRIRDLK
ncbi:DUF3232 domain-containing protein [Candidatus Falkowbacteria bacterium]|nr:DUF3232 domain-containing protein [Candidatus Falkowbacteria bacterium]